MCGTGSMVRFWSLCVLCKVCGFDYGGCVCRARSVVLIMEVVLYEHSTYMYPPCEYLCVSLGCYDCPLKHSPVTEGEDQPF